MIQIRKSPTADTRTCDYANVTRDTLIKSSEQHIADVQLAMSFFQSTLFYNAQAHDFDKLSNIDWFHEDFKTGFKQTGWWDEHRKVNRHHINMPDGVRDDVNLLDVLEYIADCVMAGMARSGMVYDLSIDPKLLAKAFHNTVELLKKQVEVVD